MGVGRIPGPYGKGMIFGSVLIPGPLGLYPEVSHEFPLSPPGPMGSKSPLGSTVAGSVKPVAKEDEDELKLLVQVYGNVKNKAGDKLYVYWKKKKKQYRVDDYIKDRNEFFGSAKAYADYRDKARAELDADDGKLRKYIEPNLQARKKVTDWKKAQDVFYAWVRKAYEKQLGDKVDIPKLIRSMMSEKLKTALAKVKIDYGKKFQYGGFNPRPMKLNGYRLGTISEHGLGTALDIESAKNAHIETGTWIHILAFTGKSLDHGSRKTKWKTAPKELYDGIKGINDEFVSRLTGVMKDSKEAAQKIGESAGATEQQKAKAAETIADPLAAAIDQNVHLKNIGAKFLKQWKNGFFDLPWDLVKELHEEQFLWGATFAHPDLHHFEL